MSFNEDQSDLLIQKLQTNESNTLSFFNDLNIENEHINVDHSHQLNISLSTLCSSDQAFDQPISSSSCFPVNDTSSNTRTMHSSSDDSSTLTTTSQTKKFPLTYILPKFDKTFEEAAANPSTAYFGARCKKKQQLVKTIRDDVINSYGIDFYPTAFQFDRMIVSVKNKYPQLTKVFGDDMVSFILKFSDFGIFNFFIVGLINISIETAVLA